MPDGPGRRGQLRLAGRVDDSRRDRQLPASADPVCTFFANVGSYCSGDASRNCTASYNAPWPDLPAHHLRTTARSVLGRRPGVRHSTLQQGHHRDLQRRDGSHVVRAAGERDRLSRDRRRISRAPIAMADRPIRTIATSAIAGPAAATRCSTASWKERDPWVTPSNSCQPTGAEVTNGGLDLSLKGETDTSTYASNTPCTGNGYSSMDARSPDRLSRTVA